MDPLEPRYKDGTFPNSFTCNTQNTSSPHCLRLGYGQTHFGVPPGKILAYRDLRVSFEMAKFTTWEDMSCYFPTITLCTL